MGNVKVSANGVEPYLKGKTLSINVGITYVTVTKQALLNALRTALLRYPGKVIMVELDTNTVAGSVYIDDITGTEKQ